MTSETNGKLWGQAAVDWAEVQEKTCLPVYKAVFMFVGLEAESQYLDCGCGAGLAAQVAAQNGAAVAGLDASEALLAIARERTPAGDFRQGDLEQLPFANNSFDLVSGFNSFQYAADPVRALAEAKRVAKPGAAVVIMVWGTPQEMDAASLLAALRPLLPTPPAGAPGPFALSDETALRTLAMAAGLGRGELLDVDSPWVYRDLPTALRGLRSSGVAARALRQSGVEAVDAAHAAALAPFRQADGSYKVGATFRCLIGQA